MPSAARAAATSSWVERGLHPDHDTSAPAATRVFTSTAVSLVTCRHPATRIPFRLCAFPCVSLRAMRTGILDCAHSILNLPAEASPGSLILLFAMNTPAQDSSD